MFRFILSPYDSVITFILWDHDVITRNDFIAEGSLAIGSLP